MLLEYFKKRKSFENEKIQATADFIIKKIEENDIDQYNSLFDSIGVNKDKKRESTIEV